MPTFEIVCLANSRKRAGRCVAGLRTDGAGWLRPVGSNAEGILHSYHYTLPDNTEARLLDVLRIECSRAHPRPHHPEDWVAMPVLWRLVERPITNARLEWLRSQLTRGPHLLGSPQDRIRCDALQSRPLAHSLALIAPQDLHWMVKPGKEKEAEHRVRACFHLDGAEYNLALTDPLWEQRLQHLPPGEYPRHAARLKDTDDVWLTVSLSEPFAPAEGEEEFCFKLAAGVIVVPKAGVKGVTVDVGRGAKTAAVSNGESHAVKTRTPLPDLSHYPDPFAETDAVAVVRAAIIDSLAEVSQDAQESLTVTVGATVVPEELPDEKLPTRFDKMRQQVPRAFMRWTEEEDALLHRLASEAESADQIANQMQRHKGAVLKRLEKLGLLTTGADEPIVQAVVFTTRREAQQPHTNVSHAVNTPHNAQSAESQQAVRAAPQNMSETATHTAPEGQRTRPLGKQTTGAGENDIRVAVCGAAGRMGREVVKAVVEADGLHLVAAIDVASAGIDAGELAGAGRTGVHIETELEPALLKWKPDVLVDFTLPDSVKRNAIVALENGVAPVIGTTGLSPSDLSTLDALAKEKGIGAFIAPNFAIGAVLAMQFAAQAARYLPDVEIIELHHEKKLDSPSGTALLTAQKIAQARQAAGQTPQSLPANLIEKAPGARGARHANTGDVPIHSVRLPGFVAHQEVIFGGVGEILTIRHDSTSRTSFMPGVVLAVRKVRTLSGLVIGLENLLV
jgi:4-hydroxy-tetrahydrodipicolinate reductase